MKKLDKNVSSNTGLSTEAKSSLAAAREARTIQSIPLSFIDIDSNVRSSYDQDKLNELAESIKSIGLLQPITLFDNGERYTVKFGHRRVLAARIAGLSEIDAFVRPPYADSKDRAVTQLIENVQREDLPPRDLEVAVRDLLDFMKGDANAVASFLGKSRRWVNYITGASDARDALPPEAQVKAEELGSRELFDLASKTSPDKLPDAVEEAVKEKSSKGAPAVKSEKKEKPVLSFTVSLMADGSISTNLTVPDKAKALIDKAVEIIRAAKQKEGK